MFKIPSVNEVISYEAQGFKGVPHLVFEYVNGISFKESVDVEENVHLPLPMRIWERMAGFLKK